MRRLWFCVSANFKEDSARSTLESLRVAGRRDPRYCTRPPFSDCFRGLSNPLTTTLCRPLLYPGHPLTGSGELGDPRNKVGILTGTVSADVEPGPAQTFYLDFKSVPIVDGPETHMIRPRCHDISRPEPAKS